MSEFFPKPRSMAVLLIGGGVIGSVYSGQIALAGHKLWILAYGDREQELTKQGIALHDVGTGKIETVQVELAQTTSERTYNLVIVAVQAEQLSSTFPALRALLGAPHIVFFGNNPDGHATIPAGLPGSIELAFPGVAGSVQNGVVAYVQIPQQPTLLEASPSPTSRALQAALESRSLPVHRTANIDGWLAYHAVFISCILMALQKVGTDPERLGCDSKRLRLMCQAITEGFKSLKAQHVQGLPRNLAILHGPLLRPVAVRYWSGVMRSPKGELYFAAHFRHAPAEIQTLVSWVIKHVVNGREDTNHIEDLLSQ